MLFFILIRGRKMFLSHKFWMLMRSLIVSVLAVLVSGGWCIADAGEDIRSMRGEVDYFKYLNDRYRSRLDPDKNAVVWMMRIYGVNGLAEEYLESKKGMSEKGKLEEDLKVRKLAEKFYQYLGMKLLNGKVHGLVDCNVYSEKMAKEKLALGEIKNEGKKAYIQAMLDEYDTLVEGVWRAEESPRWAKWLKDSEPVFELYVKGSRCHYYYIPMLRSKADGMMLSSRIPSLAFTRWVSIAISTRANLRIGEGDLRGAMEDSLAILRMGRLMTRGKNSTGITYTVGLSLERRGYDLMYRIMEAKGFTRRLGKQMLREVAGLKKRGKLTDVIHTERVIMLDMVQAGILKKVDILEEIGVFVSDESKGKPKGESDVEHEVEAANFIWLCGKVNLDKVRAYINGRFDRALLRDKSGLKLISDDYPEKGIDWLWLMGIKDFQVIDESGQVLVKEAIKHEKDLNIIAGRLLWQITKPALNMPYRAAKKMKMVKKTLRVGVGLALYKQKYGEYPERLEQLIGRQFGVKRLPRDPNDKKKNAIGYRVKEDGSYMIWWVGENGVDDGGVKDKEKEKDDFVFVGGELLGE